MNEINSFQDEYAFLSNFYPCTIVDRKGNVWPSSEHLYQAMKSTDPKVQKVIREFPFKGLKAIGKGLTIRQDWDTVKLDYMEKIVRLKFTQNKDLQKQLLNTYPAILIEDNYWHDNYWGNCACLKCTAIPGYNWLGKILVKIRAEFKLDTGNIQELAPNEIFVFGSNLDGRHGKGAAKTAHDKFGAEYGVGEGPTGQCYAIPTKDRNLHIISLSDITLSVRTFIKHVFEDSNKLYLLTPIGCGLAGYTPDQIAPLFDRHLFNLVIPKIFKDILTAHN